MASTILVPYRGVVELTGEHDTGKTIAMLQTVKNFSKTVFVDDDIKGEGTVKQLYASGTEFEDYIDLAKERRKLSSTPTADEILEGIVFPLIDKVSEKKHDVIIFDTWRMIYQAARGHVERNQHKYKDVVTWRGTNEIIQGLISKVARMIERECLTKLKDSCDLLLISHHIKANYKANIEIGVIPESSKTFDEICNMRIWLKKNPYSAVPIMLFLKRPNIPVMTSKGMKATNIVPMKITPISSDESVWDAISRYEKNPLGNRIPNADETPTAEELATIQGTLTPDQQNFVKEMIAYNKQTGEELSNAIETQTDVSPAMARALELVKASKPSQDAPGSTPAGKASDSPSNVVELLQMSKDQLGYNVINIQDVLGMPMAEINKTFKKEYWMMLKENFDKQNNGATAKSELKKAKKK